MTCELPSAIAMTGSNILILKHKTCCLCASWRHGTSGVCGNCDRSCNDCAFSNPEDMVYDKSILQLPFVLLRLPATKQLCLSVLPCVLLRLLATENFALQCCLLDSLDRVKQNHQSLLMLPSALLTLPATEECVFQCCLQQPQDCSEQQNKPCLLMLPSAALRLSASDNLSVLPSALSRLPATCKICLSVLPSALSRLPALEDFAF